MLGRVLSRRYTDASTNESYTTSNEYNNLGWLIKTIDEDENEVRYSYDKLGKVVLVTEKDDSEKSYTYDVMGRLKSESSSDSSTTYNYDSKGRLSSVNFVEDTENPSYIKTYTYEYDFLGRLTKDTKSSGHFATYSYDNMSNLVSTKDYFGNVTNYTYTPNNNISTLSVNGKTFNYTYYDDNTIKSIQYPNQLKVEYEYDQINQLTKMKQTFGSRDINTYDISYDQVGSVKSVRSFEGEKRYNYDSVGRMTEAKDSETGSYTTLTYDIRNNIKSETENRQITNLPKTCTYDWHDNGTLKSFTDENNKVTGYTYDYKGLRESKSSTDKNYHYFYDSLGRLTNEHINGSSISVIYDTKPLVRIIDGNYYYYLTNNHGDIVSLVDENGVEKNHYKYDPWGNIKESSEQVYNDLKYTSQVCDDESGNYYLRTRYYDPKIKRFISKDGYEGTLDNPISQNQYIYCLNNPANYFDPSGRSAKDLMSGDFGGGIYIQGGDGRYYTAHYIKGHDGSYGKYADNTDEFGKSYRPVVSKHGTLDLIGVIPFVGEPADAVNGTMYLLEGDKLNASLSYGSAIPFAGYGALAAKYSDEFAMGLKVATQGMGKTVFKNIDDGLNFTMTTAKHMENAGRYVPVEILRDAIKSTKGIPDPRGSDALMYYTTMYKNGNKYNLEVLYDEATNTIYHFEYARKAMGDLPKISK